MLQRYGSLRGKLEKVRQESRLGVLQVPEALYTLNHPKVPTLPPPPKKKKKYIYIYIYINIYI